jgi:hypothetical protein
MDPDPTGPIQVVDQGSPLTFTFEDMLRYAGPGSPAGVAMAYQAMRAAFSHLDPDAPLERREIRIETAFRGPGARDGFELVTRSLTEGRYLVTATLEHPERGVTLEQFVFRLLFRARGCTLLVRDTMVSEEFVTMARKSDRSPDEERHFTELKRTHAEHLLASRPEDVFEVIVDT